mmetsp:Transcript_1156/g.1862  ORF Transcript_1156/g.1862 Transcript_1156/m.1862 type:complete len:457 (+) Transcript_1156:45-1415(+)
MATELNSLMNECVEAFPATSPFAVCLSLALRVYGADTPTELDKSQTCDLFNLVGGCYNGNKGSSSVAACEQLEDLGDHYCESEFVANVWGISLLLLLILWLVLVLTCFRHTSHGALVKKNLRILRTVLLRTILGGFFSLIIIGVLVFVVLYFTHTTPLTIDLASPVGGVSYPFVTPFRENDQFRKFLFQTIRPFGGLLILIVFTQSISMIIIGFVHEKETRMKELLRISGMGSLGYYFSFVLTFIIQFLPLCIALACLTKYGQIFPNQTLSELSFFFMSFLFSYIGFSQCIVGHFKCYSPVFAEGDQRELCLNVLSSKLVEIQKIGAVLGDVESFDASTLVDEEVQVQLEEKIACLLLSGGILALMGDLEPAKKSLDDLLFLYANHEIKHFLRKQKDPYAPPWAMYELAAVHLRKGEKELAKKLLQKAQSLCQNTKNPFSFSHMLNYKCAGALREC